MTDPNRWQVEGATPEAKALIEEMLTDDVMNGIETEAADEAAQRALYGAECVKAVDEFAAKLPGAWTHDAPGVDERGLMTCTIHSDCVAGIIRPEFATPRRRLQISAGRHMGRDHWMKRLFLRGRK